ncbi:MAG: NCS2 family permease [Chlamydiota bacterium]
MLQAINRYFELDKHNTSIQTELIAALSTWSTMTYIIIVNPRILSKTGMDFGSVMTATILTAAFTTLVMGLLARYPIALASGMGINGYFAFSIVTTTGLTWQAALAACSTASVILITLNVLGIRQLIMEKLPKGIRVGTIAGIGIMLSFIGLRDVNLIVTHDTTLVTIGYMDSPEAMLAIIGILLITSLMYFGVQPAIIATVLLLWSFGFAFGMTPWRGFASLPPTISHTLFQLDFSEFWTVKFFYATLSFVFIIIFDATGTLLSLTEQLGVLDQSKKFPCLKKALFCDATGTAMGAILGTSPTSNYLESGAGIAAGGKTGLTSVFISLLFLSCLFLAPFVSSIPLFAISPVLIVIGALMARGFRHVDWNDITEYVPAFVTMITIPLTFNIPGGLGLGMITYVGTKFLTGNIDKIHWINWLITILFVVKFLLV